MTVVETSAGISLATIVRAQRRAIRGDAALVAVLLVAGLAALSSTAAGAWMTAQASALVRCEHERDTLGVGLKAALHAMDMPAWQQRFVYRVAADDDGYRVRLVVKDGPFLGDTWEQDVFGDVHHVVDVCGDRFREEFGTRLLAVLGP